MSRQRGGAIAGPVLGWILLWMWLVPKGVPGASPGGEVMQRDGGLPRQGGRGQEGGDSSRAAGQGRRGVRMPTPAFRTEVPPRSHDVLLGRPGPTSVVLSLLAFQPMEAWVEHGLEGEVTGMRTETISASAGIPREFRLAGLTPGAAFWYRLHHRSPGGEAFVQDPRRLSHAVRPAGMPFSFTVQADSHLDYGTEPALYEHSLRIVRESHPDFHVDLGDTFMTDKYLRYQDSAAQYLAQRYYLGLVGHSVPVFLALGNHDGEYVSRPQGGDDPEAMAEWAVVMRKRFFPNPEPDGFYTGNTRPHTRSGPLQNYYGWEWGDALFLVLDPFRYSTRPRGGGGNDEAGPDNWGRTLGREQYSWLVAALGASKARFCFVFIHHLVGGATREGRGGAEASGLFEWGGHDADGRNVFGERRPGWEAPIHDLLARRGGVVVFHGHDHMFVRGERGGVIYQMVPQPGHPRPTTRSAPDYGYRSGVILPGSGIVRVLVSPTEARVDYMQLSGDSERVAHSYVVPAWAQDH